MRLTKAEMLQMLIDTVEALDADADDKSAAAGRSQDPSINGWYSGKADAYHKASAAVLALVRAAEDAGWHE